MAVPGWQELLREPASERHIVQLYRDPAFLADAVAEWVTPALLEGGGGALLVCTPENAGRVLLRLREQGVDPAPALASGHLVIADAQATLARFMVDGAPDRARFRAVGRELLARVRPVARSGAAPARAWGEMVDLLWHRGEAAAAQGLESAWNDLIDETGLRLLCSYELDNLHPDTHEGALRQVCAAHSQLIPERDYACFDLALGQALVEVLGEEAAMQARTQYARRRVLATGMPAAQAVLVALHAERPEVARRVLAATRERLRA